MRTQPLVRVIAVLAGLMAGQMVSAQDARLQAVIGGALLPPARVASIVVDAGALDVDAATVILDIGRANPPSLGDAVEVRGGESIFKGEIVGIEPLYVGGESKVVIRAFNRLHRLTRGRRSRTYEKKTDADIVSRIAVDNGLVAGPALPELNVSDY